MNYKENEFLLNEKKLPEFILGEESESDIDGFFERDDIATSVSAKEEEETTNKQINKRKREIEGFDLWVGTWITEILQLEVLCCQETSVRRSGSVQS